MFSKAKFVRWLYVWHKWTGILGGAFLLAILLTGTVAVFKHEIDWLVTPALRVEPQPEKKPLEAMLASVRNAYPDAKINNVSISDDAKTAYVFALGEDEDSRKAVFVNPYTAEVTGERQGETVANVIRQTHVRFYAFGANGRIVVGFFGLILLLSSITGLIIYFPFMKVVFKKGLRFWQLRPGFRAASSDLHKLVGILTLVFNLILGATGAVLGLENLARYHKPLQTALHPQANKEFKPQSLENQIGLDEAVKSAGQNLIGFTPTSITLPQTGKNHFVLYGNVAGRFERKGASFVVVDTTTGAVLQTHSAAQVSTGVWLYNINEPLHFGDFAGIWLKIVYFLFGAAGTSLCVTGFVLLYLRKRKLKRAEQTVRIPVLSPAATNLIASGETRRSLDSRGASPKVTN
jgi:uncharacterized iron-regulated membrane protein